MLSSSWHCAAAPLSPFVEPFWRRSKLQLYTRLLIHSSLPPYLKQAPHTPNKMATLRLLTLCAMVSTALSFVAMGPPSRHTAAATTRPTFTAWGSRGRTSQVGTLAAGRLLRSGRVCVVLYVCAFLGVLVSSLVWA